MIAVRRLVDGRPGEAEVVTDSVGDILIRDGKAVAANLRTPSAPDDELPHVDEFAEVHGLTDRDPEFFEKQSNHETERARAKDLGGVPALDRMSRGGKRKGP